MNILCAYSGISFTVQHFPASLNSRECYHPIFDIPQKKLFGYIPKWSAHELTDTDSYLLYLALLNSTDLVEWRVPAFRTSQTTAIVASNMESLLRIIGKMNIIVNPSLVLHPEKIFNRIAITPETKTLENSHIWIKNWHEAFGEFESGNREAEIQRRIMRREEALEKLIRDPNKPVAHYARILADWAADAADFPNSPLPIDGKVTSCREYWKQIIVKCTKNDAIFMIPANDIQELIDHCETNMDIQGSIQAHKLMKVLRGGLTKQSDYLGFGTSDSGLPNYRIISAQSTVEDANKMAMIDSAPTEKPVERNYPSKIAFLRAKLKWDMATEFKKQQSESGNGNNGVMVHGIGEI